MGINVNINFTEEDYNYFKKVVKQGYWDNGNDSCGYINIGAVNCEFSIREFQGFEHMIWTYGKNSMALSCDFHLLGKDRGYARVNGIPYCYTGFYVIVKDTYKETLKSIFESLYDIITSDLTLLAGAKETELTWDKIKKI